ncbi:hypothetical protein F5H01DRAFT_352881 [Linnemannia elongata]|nr:hypothetical protein F5H01DRAFT_352881 [Linnemannia elongata]
MHLVHSFFSLCWSWSFLCYVCLPMREFIFLQPHSFLLNERQLLMVATLCIHHPRREADIIPTVLSRNTSFVLFKWFIFCFSFISGFREWCCSLGVWGNKSGLWSTRLSVFLEADWNNKKKKTRAKTRQGSR